MWSFVKMAASVFSCACLVASYSRPPSPLVRRARRVCCGLRHLVGRSVTARTRAILSSTSVGNGSPAHKVYMELGSYFLFLQEQIKDIIISPRPDSTDSSVHACGRMGVYAAPGAGGSRSCCKASCAGSSFGRSAGTDAGTATSSVGERGTKRSGNASS
jgi:hypothetical protein